MCLSFSVMCVFVYADADVTIPVTASNNLNNSATTDSNAGNLSLSFLANFITELSAV